MRGHHPTTCAGRLCNALCDAQYRCTACGRSKVYCDAEEGCCQVCTHEPRPRPPCQPES